MFESYDKITSDMRRKIAQVRALQDEIPDMIYRRLHALIEDAESFKGKWILTENEGCERIFHVIDVRPVRVFEWKDKTKGWEDSNLFKDRVHLTFDETGGLLDGEFWYNHPELPETHTYFIPTIRKAKIVTEDELRKRYPKFALIKGGAK